MYGKSGLQDVMRMLQDGCQILCKQIIKIISHICYNIQPWTTKRIIYYCEVIEAGRSGIELNLYQCAHMEHLHNLL